MVLYLLGDAGCEFLLARVGAGGGFLLTGGMQVVGFYLVLWMQVVVLN